MSQSTAFNALQEVQLRFLCPDDIPELRLLCADWFPIQYPDTWYNDITSGARFHSMAATVQGKIIGMIVCQVKPRTRCNKEDGDILSSQFLPSTDVAYILSLGVIKEYRRQGIASLLLDNLISYLTTQVLTAKAVYLHVLSSNTTAIRFYERRAFRVHNFLPYYYSIEGRARDGYCYVLYINGGKPPWTLLDVLRSAATYMSRLNPCLLSRRLYLSARSLWRHLVSRPPPAALSQIRYS